MGTLATIQVVTPQNSAHNEAEAAIDRAFGWFYEIEARCTRFNPASELMLLTAQTGIPVPASDILYEAVRFALMVAEETGGAFLLFEDFMSQGKTTPLHIHANEDETLYVLEGEILVHIDGSEHSVGPRGVAVWLG